MINKKSLNSKSLNGDAEGWFPKNYNPNLSVSDWIELLNDPTIFNVSSLEVMKRMKDHGGMATCTQLANKYGRTVNFYNNSSYSVAQRVAKKTGCLVFEDEEGNERWWPVLYMGKDTDKNVEGTYIWKLRKELDEALDEVDLSEVHLYAENDLNEEEQGYWWLNASPAIWSFSKLDVGQIQSYTLYNDKGNKRRIFQNFLDAKVGDIVIGYESNPVKQVVAIAKVIQENDGQEIYFQKIEGLSTPIDYSTLKECPKLANMEYFINPNGSLFKLTKDEFELIMDLIREVNPITRPNIVHEKYTKEDFLGQVYMSEKQLELMMDILKYKKNLILKGAPGVGKTFTAKRLAYTMMGEKDDSRIEIIQFHQSYSYEDFIMGYRPCEGGFKLMNGVFYQFCQMASNHPDKDYFFIIDEINRGNMSKIFGELLMLIEKDYRGTKVTLSYNGISFNVPNNLYIIGMMNTADRSLAMIDYALRRRFAFFEMEPAFESDGFKAAMRLVNYPKYTKLVECIRELNKEIEQDEALGKGFKIGHSYLCTDKMVDDTWLKLVVEYEIIPLIEEYWFDEPRNIDTWSKRLRDVLND